uniref:rRNA N-glycosylase n=1 Tax=Oryza barthii TaxID=65489 RepID=A0A0D3GN61_9ORYZ
MGGERGRSGNCEAGAGRESVGEWVQVIHVRAATAVGQADGEDRNREATCAAPIQVINKGHGESTLAIRPDNVYLIGFKTQAASWFAFKNSYNLISRATALGFDDSYTSLTGKGGYTNLKDIVVGKKSAQEAVATLAKYKKDGSVPEEEIKKALTTFILIICEAVRLVPVRTDVITVWDEAEGGKVGKVACDLTVKWKVISCAFLIFDKTRKWDPIPEAQNVRDFGSPKITTAETAADNIYLILNTKDCKIPK